MRSRVFGTKMQNDRSSPSPSPNLCLFTIYGQIFRLKPKPDSDYNNKRRLKSRINFFLRFVVDVAVAVVNGSTSNAVRVDIVLPILSHTRYTQTYSLETGWAINYSLFTHHYWYHVGDVYLTFAERKVYDNNNDDDCC